MAVPRVFTLKCAVQQYAWGRIGEDSEVAKLSKASDNNFQLQKLQPYAELWMGTHPKGPSILSSSQLAGTPLKDWIHKNPECLGEKVRKKFNDQLPFLFKILSVNKSLSIQAHPNKSHAEQLHALRPDKYPDDNHKPEMALAITPFEGMNGFREIAEIVRFLEVVPEFKAVIGESNADELAEINKLDASGKSDSAKVALKKCFSSLMTRDSQIVLNELEKLKTRLQNLVNSGQSTSDQNGELVLRLCGQFPGDVGCFASFFFNRLVLQPGQAMFLGPNEPHAYLSGNCIECMACSDNVVRAGLTPKYKDVPTLCDMLTYNTSSPEDRIFVPVQDPTDAAIIFYNPPVVDFSIAKIELTSDCREYTLASYDSASLIIFIRGKAVANSPSILQSLSLGTGSVIFVSANESVNLKLEPAADGLLAFRAFCPLD